jgi:DNA-binding PadR family transcriptional regulator
VAWEDLELLALRWLHASPPEDAGGVSTGEMHLGGENAAQGLPELTESQFDQALRRLEQHGLIVGERDETSDLVYWLHLRLSANGLRVLGEWPPAEGAAINDALAAVLCQLAPELPDDDATATRQAGSTLTKMSAGIVYDVFKEQAQQFGEGLG